MKTSRMKRLAIGATVVGAFVAGAVVGAKRKKVKALAAKAERNVKSKVRKIGSAARRKMTDVRDASRDKVVAAIS